MIFFMMATAKLSEKFFQNWNDVIEDKGEA